VQVLGTNTISSMQSGIFYGYLGQVEYLVNQLKNNYGSDLKVIATGGLATNFKDCTQVIDIYDEYLTLKGLRWLAES
ncbi:MAG TPA: pantothenate kinase, partial [Clostridiales bacterium]|nr:pantothenate kinase [Clostridiales bacterium]